MPRAGGRRRPVWIALLGGAAVLVALGYLHRADRGTVVTPLRIGDTPARVYRPASGIPGPVVVIAHGFAGSQQLMQSFALTFARNGYTAVTFDFPGHGRHPRPLTGDTMAVTGATQVLVDETRHVAAFARRLGNGKLAVLGHSMASDVVIRFAQSAPDVTATIAVSMFSPAVTARSPANLLLLAGDWETTLKREALRAVALESAPALPRPGVTYGQFALGTARRAAFSRHVEHVGVLFSQDSLRESVRWLDQDFGTLRRQPPVLDCRGPAILLLFAGIIVLGYPLSRLLPRIATPAVGAGLGWRDLWLPLLVPMLLTPLLLRVLPTHFLPILVADYLAAHFALYGLLSIGCLAWSRRRMPPQQRWPALDGRFLGAVAGVVAFGFVGLVWPIDRYVTSFVAGPRRLEIVAALLVGTLLYFLSDEWLTRGSPAPRGAYAASKLAFLASLALAVALDLQRLFFLIIIIPIILLFFVAYGLFSRWIYQRTGHPFVAGVGNAVAFAWAIGVTFPMMAG